MRGGPGELGAAARGEVGGAAPAFAGTAHGPAPGRRGEPLTLQARAGEAAYTLARSPVHEGP